MEFGKEKDVQEIDKPSFLRTSKKPAEILLRMFLLVTFLMVINLLFCLKIEWNIFIKRLLAFKDLNSMWSAIVAVFATDDASTLFKYIHQFTSDQNALHYSASRNCNLKEFRARLKVVDTNVSKVFMAFIIMCGVLPYSVGIIMILKSDPSEISADRLPFIMTVYYPEDYRSVNVFLIVQTIMFLWYAMIIYLWDMNLKSMLLSIECVTHQTDFVCETLQRIDEIIATTPKTGAVQSQIESFNSTPSGKDDLKDFFNQIIKDHQSICSAAKMLNGKVNGITMGFMNIFGFQLCICLMFIVEAKEITLKVRHVFRYCLVSAILFFCTIKCQKLKDKGQQLRDAVYGSSWTDKPRWLRKSLTVMMTMANKDMQISPYGIYVIDMSYMTSIVKASFTYFNVLSALKA
ncbi:hypothetical protein LSTR_LSTR003950 [Laodelphax striatellus]|uniref:Odorant receptor n=1 Tax=Laodelphax striatellus TaxID=195883 RepID=A0A482X2F9_LAOST|nr:hypothetical protein LSTR_LSTR003950 [Laodelphax striatellus]